MAWYNEAPDDMKANLNEMGALSLRPFLTTVIAAVAERRLGTQLAVVFVRSDANNVPYIAGSSNLLARQRCNACFGLEKSDVGCTTRPHDPPEKARPPSNLTPPDVHPHFALGSSPEYSDS